MSSAAAVSGPTPKSASSSGDVADEEADLLVERGELVVESADTVRSEDSDDLVAAVTGSASAPVAARRLSDERWEREPFETVVELLGALSRGGASGRGP